MKLVIDISEEIYTYILSRYKYQDKTDIGLSGFDKVGVAIKNGIPLPKGHGKNADIDKLLEEMRATRTYDIPFAMERVKPIVEADKGVLEKINEKQDSLWATCKAWDEAIEKDGYVN